MVRHGRAPGPSPVTRHGRVGTAARRSGRAGRRVDARRRPGAGRERRSATRGPARAVLELEAAWSRDFDDPARGWWRLISEVFDTLLVIMVGAGAGVTAQDSWCWRRFCFMGAV